jgi:hypothetical protein
VKTVPIKPSGIVTSELLLSGEKWIPLPAINATNKGFPRLALPAGILKANLTTFPSATVPDIASEGYAVAATFGLSEGQLVMNAPARV